MGADVTLLWRVTWWFFGSKGDDHRGKHLLPSGTRSMASVQKVVEMGASGRGYELSYPKSQYRFASTEGEKPSTGGGPSLYK